MLLLQQMIKDFTLRVEYKGRFWIRNAKKETETSVDDINTNRGSEHEFDNSCDKDEQSDYRKYSYFY